MANNTTILDGYTDMEKGAYLGAIASLATADRQASEEELQYLQQLCDAALLSNGQKEVVIRAATEMTDEDLNRCLDVLKNSELKYSLVTDLMAFARADNDYSEAEEQFIQKISNYLGLDQRQFSLLDEFSKQATKSKEAPEQKPKELLEGGMQEKLQSAGINGSRLLNGVLSIAAPMLIGGMISRSFGRRSGYGYGHGGFGGGFGGFGMGGGLFSMIGMLSGGRGMRSTGGLLGRIFGRRYY